MRGLGFGVRRWLGLVGGGCAAINGGCILDHNRCDAHQVELHGAYAVCVCAEGAVANANGVGCTPCAENEVVQNGACACAPGSAKATPDAGCTKSELGAACNAAQPCSSAYPYCVSTGTADGYCSLQNCTSNADCPVGFSCEKAAGTRYCHRPPTGLGAACGASADCAAFDANYCETLQSHTCILQGCATGAVACPNEWACCDYSALLGSPLSICSAPASQVDGNCPQGGRRVTP